MTKTYTVKGPDGSDYLIDGPDNATPAQVAAAAQAHFQGNSQETTDAAQPNHNMVPPEVAAASANQPGNTIGQGVAKGLGMGLAAMHSFENMATFGQGDKVAAQLSTWLQPVAKAVGLRDEAPKGYGENLADIRQQYGQLESDNPVSSLTGSAAGLFGGGNLLGLAGKGVKTVADAAGLGKVARVTERLLTPTAGAPITNALKNGLVGGGLAGGMSAANGDDAGAVLFNTGVGAVASPAIGFAADKAARLFQGASGKAMLAVSRALKMEPDELQKLYTDFFAQTGGKNPSIAELANFKSETTLRNLSAQNADIGVMANQAARGSQTQAQQLDTSASGIPQTYKGIIDNRNARMDQLMGGPKLPDTGLRTAGALGNRPVATFDEIQQILNRPGLAMAREDNPQLNRALTRVLGNGKPQFTVDDFDSLRQSLGKTADSLYTSNSQMAEDVKLVRDALTSFAGQRVPEYGQALEGFRHASDYARGFKFGRNGGNAGDAMGEVSASLDRHAGQFGFAHGQALANSEATLSRISPTNLPSQDPNLAQMGGQALQAVTSGAVGWAPSASNHAIKAIPGAHFGPETQAAIGRMLFDKDPQVVQQGIANLRRARIKDQDILDFAQRVGGSTGANIAHVMQGN